MDFNNPLSRTALLTGLDGLERLSSARVIIFGLGGVGSWAAETLVRTGVRQLTIVDADTVAPSNINRQMPATAKNVGEAKVEAVRRRLLDICPEAEITTVCGRYTAETAERFNLEEFDYVIDAIDSLADKALLILRATEAMAATARSERPTTFFSSMGAALKLDPSRIAVAEFWKVKGCPLAAALRRRFKKSGQMPRRKFRCVYSDELVANHDIVEPGEEAGADTAMRYGKVATNGSVMHITAIFGITLASLVIRHRLGRLG